MLSVTNASLASNQALNANFNSPTPLDVSRLTHVAIHSTWTGTPTGTLKAQYSCDVTDNPSAVANWVDIPNATASLSGSAGGALWDIQTGVKWVRVTYAFTSGTGALNVRANGKGAN